MKIWQAIGHELCRQNGYSSRMEGYESRAKKVVAALNAVGYVIVPREPTPEMSDAAFMNTEIEGHSHRTLIEAGWRAMIDAALDSDAKPA